MPFWLLSDKSRAVSIMTGPSYKSVGAFCALVHACLDLSSPFVDIILLLYSQGNSVAMENAAMSWLAQFASHSLAGKGTCTVLEAGSDPVHTLIAPGPGHWHTLHALDLQRKSAHFSILTVVEGDTGLLQPFLPRPVPFPHPQCRASSFEGSHAASCPGGPNSP